MKKAVYLVLTLVMVMTFWGCASSNVPDMDEIPEFYLNPPVAEDAVYGVGDAKMSSLSMSRTTAISRARDDIARQVEVTVKSALTDYAQEAGEGENKQVLNFVESVSRQIANVTLKGVKTKEVAVAKDGTVYALCEYPISALIEESKKEFVRNEAAAFAEWKADQALEKLNSEIQSNPPRAGE
jgi:hypothetical protein